MERHVPGHVWQNKDNRQKTYMHDILWCIIHGNWCIRCWPWSQIITGNGWQEVWVWWSARQRNTAPNCICQQRILSTEWCFSNMYHGAPGILLGLGKIDHYCFAREVCIITDPKALVAILSKHVVAACYAVYTPIQGMHYIHPGSDLYITDWMSINNHTGNKDQKITGMNINVNAISIPVYMPVCTSVEDIQVATHEDAYLQKLKSYVVHG